MLDCLTIVKSEKKHILLYLLPGPGLPNWLTPWLTSLGRKNVKVARIGDSRYKDYPTYIGERGLNFANIRRVLYYKRHKKDIDKEGSPGYLSSILL